MQSGMDHASPNWIQIAFGLLAAFLTGGAGFKLLNTWLSRKKIAAETHEIEARATEITIRAHSALGEAAERYMRRLEDAHERIDELRNERDRFKGEVEQQKIELGFYDLQLKRMQGMMAAKGIKMSDFDEPKQ